MREHDLLDSLIVDKHLVRLIINNVYDLCYVTDCNTNELLYISESMKKTLGIEDTMYDGCTCSDIMHDEKDSCIFCANNPDSTTPETFYTSEYLHPSSKRCYQIKSMFYTLDGHNIKMGFGIDITDTKNKIAKLNDRFTLEEALVKCAKTLSENHDIKVAVNRLLSIVCEFYQADRAYIFEITPDGQFLDNTYEWCLDTVIPQIDNLQAVPMEAAELWFEKFEEVGEFFITALDDDVDKESITYKILKMQEIESLLAAPLILNGKICGFFGVDNPKGNTSDVSLLQSMALFIINDIDKKNTLDELEKRGYLDGFTGIYNRHKYLEVLETIERTTPDAIGILYLDINGLKQMNAPMVMPMVIQLSSKQWR